MKLLFSSLLLLISVAAFGGAAEVEEVWISVFERTSNQPIEGVSVLINDEYIGETNALGKLNIGSALPTDLVHLFHTSYRSEHLTYEALRTQNWKVALFESVLNIQEVVIRANRIEQEYSSSGTEVRVVDRKQADQQFVSNAADLVGLDPNIFVQKSQGGGGSPMIRGLSTSRVLIMVDGVRFNNAIFREGNVHNLISVDGQSVASAEIALGPGSVLYGSDALGGVMHFNTFEPQYGDSTEILQSLAFSISSQTNQLRARPHFRINYGQKRWAGLTAITINDYQDIRMGKRVLSWTPEAHLSNTRLTCLPRTVLTLDTLYSPEDPQVQYGTGYQQRNILQKVKWRVYEKTELKVGLHLSQTTDFVRYDRQIQLSGGAPKYARWNYGPQTWAMNYAQLESRKSTRLWDQFKYTVSGQFFQESRDARRYGNRNGSVQTEQVRIFQNNLDFTKKWNALSLLYGLEHIDNWISSTAYGYNIALPDTTWSEQSRYADGSTWRSNSAFASGEYELSDHWRLAGGMRLNQVSLFTPIRFQSWEEDSRLHFLAPSSQLGLTHHGKGYKYFLSFSTGFRAPNVDDASKVFDSQPGAVVIPNTNLREERLYSGEFGMKQQLGSRWMVDAAFYYSYMDNIMVRAPYSFDGQDSMMYDGTYSQILAVQNLDYAYMWGYHFSVRADLSRQLRFTLSWSNPFGSDSNGDPLRHVAPFNANGQLTYQIKKLKFLLTGRYNAAIDAEDMPLSEQSKTHQYALNDAGQAYSPAWYTLDLHASYVLNKNVQVRGVDCICRDRADCVHSHRPRGAAGCRHCGCI